MRFLKTEMQVLQMSYNTLQVLQMRCFNTEVQVLQMRFLHTEAQVLHKRFKV